MKRILFKLFPKFLTFGLMRIIARIKYGVRSGKGSKIYLDSFFEGHNRVLGNTEIQGSYIGLCSYVASNSIIGCAKIGKFCAIGDNVRTMVGQHPSKKFVSVHSLFYSSKKFLDIVFCKEQKFNEHVYVDEHKKYVVEVGNDVWIGNNVVIMDGIKIGDGAIIGAGAVVTKSIDPYTIVGGVPAKLIRNRFTDEQIKFLLDFKWWDRNFEWIKNNYDFFEDIENFQNKFKK